MIRPARNEAEAAQAFELASSVFGLRSRDAKLFARHNLILGFDRGGTVAGLVRLVPRVLRRGSQRLRATGLTSVCVRADQRGSGLSSLLLERSIDVARARGADLAFLVARRAADHFYPRYGFWGVASYNRILVRRQDLPPAPAALRLRPTIAADLPVLARARNACLREAFAPERDARLWRHVFERWGRWYTMLRGRRPVGYALTDGTVVHELGWLRGENASEVLAVLARRVRSGAAELEIRASATHALLSRPLALDIAVVQRQCSYGGHMVRVLNPARLAELLAARVARNMRALEITAYAEARDGIAVKCRGGRCRVQLPRGALGYRATCRLLGIDAPSAHAFRLDRALPFNLGIADEV